MSRLSSLASYANFAHLGFFQRIYRDWEPQCRGTATVSKSNSLFKETAQWPGRWLHQCLLNCEPLQSRWQSDYPVSRKQPCINFGEMPQKSLNSLCFTSNLKSIISTCICTWKSSLICPDKVVQRAMNFWARGKTCNVLSVLTFFHLCIMCPWVDLAKPYYWLYHERVGLIQQLKDILTIPYQVRYALFMHRCKLKGHAKSPVTTFLQKGTNL